MAQDPPLGVAPRTVHPRVDPVAVARDCRNGALREVRVEPSLVTSGISG